MEDRVRKFQKERMGRIGGKAYFEEIMNENFPKLRIN